MLIDIAKDFYKRPAGRVKSEGSYTGEHFREELLSKKMEEAISKKEVLVVDFSGVTMMGSSFLDESFGGLIRVNKLKAKDVLQYLRIKHTRPSLEDTIFKYIKKAEA